MKEETMERAKRAFKATRSIGLRDEEVKPILRKLYNLFDKKWELIEADNYQALLDAYFLAKEDEAKGVEVQASTAPRDTYPPSAKPSIYEGSSSNERELETVPSNRLVAEKEMPLAVRKVPTLFPNPRPKKRPSGAYNSESSNSQNHNNIQQQEKEDVLQLCDISKGAENVQISLVNEKGKGNLPKFTYMNRNLIYQDACLQISLARISDEDCCNSCFDDCVASPIPCACARETDGEFAYTKHGLLKEKFIDDCMSVRSNPKPHQVVFCKDCPLERAKNENLPEKCGGHLLRKFIKECWIKCGCDMKCGNRVVQRGIRCNLQVFMTGEGKGWGVRTLEKLAKGTFICEYVGEILTNIELYERNLQSSGSGSERHTYPVTLDADWASEGYLKDEEALCLDATYFGNVARFINHRCNDGNLIDIPVQVETPDRHYYHLAFFTRKEVGAMEELTWDYGIDFDDDEHPIKAFACCCGSALCRDIHGKRFNWNEKAGEVKKSPLIMELNS